MSEVCFILNIKNVALVNHSFSQIVKLIIFYCDVIYMQSRAQIPIVQFVRFFLVVLHIQIVCEKQNLEQFHHSRKLLLRLPGHSIFSTLTSPLTDSVPIDELHVCWGFIEVVHTMCVLLCLPPFSTSCFGIHSCCGLSSAVYAFLIAE